MNDQKPSAAALRAAKAIDCQPITMEQKAELIDAEFAPLVDALRKYANRENWSRSVSNPPVGPLDLWECADISGWNGPDFARAVLAAWEGK